MKADTDADTDIDTTDTPTDTQTTDNRQQTHTQTRTQTHTYTHIGTHTHAPNAQDGGSLCQDALVATQESSALAQASTAMGTFLAI